MGFDYFFMALIMFKYIYNWKRIVILEGRRLNGENQNQLNSGLYVKLCSFWFIEWSSFSHINNRGQLTLRTKKICSFINVSIKVEDRTLLSIFKHVQCLKFLLLAHQPRNHKVYNSATFFHIIVHKNSVLALAQWFSTLAIY